MARITLITDFGTVDGYVGVMKGVMSSLAPQLFLDDVTHDIPPGDVEKASRVLARVWSRFPQGTVHLGGFVPGAEGEEGKGRVVEVDRFGNLALDLPVDLVRRAGGVEVEGRDLPLVGSYGEGEPGELLVLVNSDGLVEIAVRDGSAAERLKVGVGELIAVQPLLVLYGEAPLSGGPVNELQDHPSHEHDGGHLEEKK